MIWGLLESKGQVQRSLDGTRPTFTDKNLHDILGDMMSLTSHSSIPEYLY